ncbi:MAG: 30S ribosomal protein S20 [Solobacterium sp.]|nr:30S ribosomal protein S20 [Solobacterium sp.]
MANIKSQKKRALTNIKAQKANAAKKTELKNAIKNVLKAVDAKDYDAAVKAYDKANSVLDKSVSNGIKKANYAARQKSRLAKAVNSVK